ncbi:MAG: AAA family ATPase [Dactylosporangium sp.]|nr:AAA family ATPase [Dactylosporangium sp.]NNJ62014.1 AAA family ATPase [Dactylosporangium sp.]
MRIFATYSIKGGTGKTSTAVNLAYLASRAGDRTLLWDLDPQAAATFLFRIKPRVKGGAKALVNRATSAADAIKGTDFEGLDLLPADFTYRNLDLVFDRAKRSRERLGRLLAPLAGEYDTVVLDCPPSVSLVSENVLRAANTLVVPLIPTTLSLRTFDQLTEFVQRSEPPRPAVVAFFSMVDRRKRLHRDLVEGLPGRRTGILPVSVPAAAVVERMAVERAPVPVFAARSPLARSYESLWETISQGPPAVSECSLEG